MTTAGERYELPEELRMARTMVKDYVHNEILPLEQSLDHDAIDMPKEDYDRLVPKTREMGLWCVGVPQEHGGAGLSLFSQAVIQEEMVQHRAGLYSPVYGTMGSPPPEIIWIGTDHQIETYGLPTMRGERKGWFAITEPSGGSDVASMQTRARPDGDHYVINGSKTFITGGMTSDFFVVGARTGGDGLAGISLFFVETDTAGFSRSALDRKMGWWCSDQATLYFDDLRVPAENLMGEQDLGFIAIMENFNLERVALIAGALGMMRVCLAESIDWAQSRQTFGKPLIRHQVIRHKIADMSARIDALEAYLNQICWIVNSGEMPVAEICKAKFFATRALAFCANEAIQILGGAGYLRGNPVERIYREVKVMAIGGGSEEIMRDLAVRQMGL